MIKVVKEERGDENDGFGVEGVMIVWKEEKGGYFPRETMPVWRKVGSPT